MLRSVPMLDADTPLALVLVPELELALALDTIEFPIHGLARWVRSNLVFRYVR